MFKMMKELNMSFDSLTYEWYYTFYSRAFTPAMTKLVWDRLLVFGTFYSISLGVSLLRLIEPSMDSNSNVMDRFAFVRSGILQLSASSISQKWLKLNISQRAFEEMLYKAPNSQSEELELPEQPDED